MKNKWQYYTTKEIKPLGWLKKQLEIQANGLCGNLDKFWVDVQESAWIGGRGENWERMPYWLDGFIPLAYLLENDDMIARVKKYMDIILSRQDSDGWICPCSKESIPTYDTWATQLFSKVLLVYYQCSKDERALNALYKMLKNYYTLLHSKKIKLFNWAKFRYFETFFAINFLYELKKEEWLVELAKILNEQGADFDNSIPFWKKPINVGSLFENHIVGIAMMLKQEAVCHDILGQEYENKAEYYHTILKHYHGTPVGLFTGDEHLSGLSPIKGTELCAVVEQMFSYETLFSLTGENKWLERLEMLAFNALPATLSDDMWTHQYVQMSNQISCEKFKGNPIFGTNGREAHLFGLQPHYPCCTVDHGQGWPKLTTSLFAYDKGVILNTIPLPSFLKTKDFEIEVTSNYPFEMNWSYTITAKKAFTFKTRIPRFAKNLKINGESKVYNEELSFEIKENQTQRIFIECDTEITVIDRPYQLKSIQYGSLVFALPIEYEEVMHEYTSGGCERKFPYCDYEYIGKSPWNYALSDFKFTLHKKSISDIPFSSKHPPLTITAKMKKIPWGLEPGFEAVCAKIPQSRMPISEEEEKELYPYGSAKLRITELPLIEE
ncbi:MAG: glycoside hydrolase family 127 protein [Clostridia bacterium]|nr:glycoside hydrolase family 127 protein [Clostridia bacterium]